MATAATTVSGATPDRSVPPGPGRGRPHLLGARVRSRCGRTCGRGWSHGPVPSALSPPVPRRPTVAPPTPPCS